MKTNKILLLILLSFSLGSCNDWLDVAPDNQVDENTLFETGEGYRNALNGIYRDMASTELYGREMTWGLADVLGQYYYLGKISTTHAYYNACKYEYKDKGLQPVIEELWAKAYNAVVNCNNLIDRIGNENPGKFTGHEMEKNLIHGEALALRAFLHFDMMRLFAPSVKTDDGKAYIPYFDRYGSVSEPRLDVKTVLSRVERDLLKAKELVAGCDTIEENRHWLLTSYRILGGIGNDVPEDIFYTYRGYRMNYYAVTAVLARVYSYANEYKKAFDQAKEVIDANYDIGQPYFTFTPASELRTNPKYYDGVIFGVSNQQTVNNFSVYRSGGATKLMLYYSTYDGMFEGDSEDRRKELLTEEEGWYYYSSKYMKQGSNPKAEDLIPLVRLSEMYYIVSEYLYRESDPAEGIHKLDEVRMARGILGGKLGDRINSTADFEKEMLKEIAKDFVGEGQLFYWYKKYDRKPVDATSFVLPLPKTELVY